MTQSAYIGGALAAGFVLFLAAKNRLTTYAAVLWGQGDTATLPPFAGVPILTTGPANTNQPSGGGGGGGGTALPYGLPAALSPFGSAGGDAAANSNWLGDLGDLGEIAAAAG